MYFQQVSKNAPDTILSNVKNGEASTALAVGSAVCYDYTTAADGNSVIIPTTAMLQHPAGIMVSQSTAAGADGLLLVKGHTALALVDGTTNVTVGDPLVLSDASVNLTKLGTLITNAIGALKMSFVAGETYTTDAAAAKKVYVNC